MNTLPRLAAVTGHALFWLGARGRFVLVAGLVAGLGVGLGAPEFAASLQALIVPAIVFMLFLAALRIGPGAAFADLSDLPRQILLVVLFQTVPSALAALALAALGWLAHPLAIGTVLVLAGAPITGSPGLALMSGANPVPALRQLVFGTALLPLTALPAFALMPVFPDLGATLLGAFKLLLAIVVAAGLGFGLRALRPGWAAPRAGQQIDGMIAATLALAVIALMSAVGPALVSGQAMFWLTLALVFVLNFASQIAVFFPARALDPVAAPSLAIVAGNRNLALFLSALPPDTIRDLLVFVGCYQIPMYLTPLVMARLYQSAREGA